MRVGDLVRNNLTDQIGIIIEESVIDGFRSTSKKIWAHSIRVLWTTDGDSLFGAGSREWTGPTHVEVINESR